MYLYLMLKKTHLKRILVKFGENRKGHLNKNEVISISVHWGKL